MEEARRPRVLLFSEAPYVATGNGYLTRYIGDRTGFLSKKYDMRVVGKRHLGQSGVYKIPFHGREFEYDLYPVYNPQSPDFISFNKWRKELDPEIILCIGDAQDMKISPYENDGIPQLPNMISYLAIDSGPLKTWVKYLQVMPNIVVPTKWAQSELNAINMPSEVIPHGIDLDWMKPISPEERRMIKVKRNISPDTIVIGGIGMNQDRKRWDLWIKIFSMLKKIIEQELHKKVLGYLHIPTYLHTPTGTLYPGIEYDILDILKLHNLEGSVAFNAEIAPLYKLSDDLLREVYGTCDILMHTAAAGAWELPINEAQAFGTIAIAQAYAGMQETCIRELLCSPRAYYPGPQSGTLWAEPDPEMFVDRVVKAIKEPDLYREKQFTHVKQFGWDRVGAMWLDYMERFQGYTLSKEWMQELTHLEQ